MENYKDYSESHDLGRFMAFLRHEIMVDNWTNMPSNGQSFIESTPYRKRLNECVTVLRSYRSNLSDISRIDMKVCEFTKDMNISALLSFIKQVMWEFEDLFNNNFYNNWASYIVDLVQAIPVPLIQSHLCQDLYYIYTEQFEQLIKPIGEEEFAKILNWSKKKLVSYETNNLLPEPAHNLCSTPLWTVGQAERFKLLVLNNTNTCKNASFGDWKSLISNPITKLELVLREDNDSPEERVYEFNNRGNSYFSTNAFDICSHEFSSLEDAIAISNYIFQKVEFAPEVHCNIGRRYLKNHIYDKALEHLEAAKNIYESVIPANFEGKIFDGNDDHYHFTLADLSYLYYLSGDIKKSRDVLLTLADICTMDFIDPQELLDQLSNSVDTFGTWYKENYLYELDSIL